MKSAIIAVGEELLEGSVTDTNSGFLAGKLSEIGVLPGKFLILPDNKSVIAKEIKNCADEFETVILTGGLGPTFDDVTIEAIADAFDKKLILNDFAKSHLEKRLGALGIEITENQLRQALYPEGADVIENPNGTACAMRLDTKNGFIYAMPGVPSEMQWIACNKLIPYIKDKYTLDEIYQANLHFRGLPESYVDRVIEDIKIPSSVRCIINIMSNRRAIVKVRSSHKEAASGFIKAIEDRLSANYTGSFTGLNEQAGAKILFDILKKRSLTLAVAESCTGGLLGATIAAVAGISAVYKGGVISYSNEVKSELLDVSPELLSKYGAVSSEVAAAMAFGVKKRLRSGCAAAVTGIAGPDGGTGEKPVGTVYISAIVGDHLSRTKRFNFSGDRQLIRRASVDAALDMLILLISEME
jgi:nicotinamide-nucleotide amidase